MTLIDAEVAEFGGRDRGRLNSRMAPLCPPVLFGSDHRESTHRCAMNGPSAPYALKVKPVQRRAWDISGMSLIVFRYWAFEAELENSNLGQVDAPVVISFWHL